MRELDLFRIFTDPLGKARILYFVTGSVASMIYGEPRLTHDVDLVVELAASAAGKVSALFPDEHFYCPPEEVIHRECRRPSRGHFNLVHHASGFKADFYTVGRDPLHRWAMECRVSVRMDDGESVWIAPPEYVILRKLEFYREGGSDKHVRDVSAMLEFSAERIDLSVVEAKVRALGLLREWELAKQGL